MTSIFAQLTAARQVEEETSRAFELAKKTKEDLEKRATEEFPLLCIFDAARQEVIEGTLHIYEAGSVSWNIHPKCEPQYMSYGERQDTRWVWLHEQLRGCGAEKVIVHWVQNQPYRFEVIHFGPFRSAVGVRLLHDVVGKVDGVNDRYEIFVSEEEGGRHLVTPADLLTIFQP